MKLLSGLISTAILSTAGVGDLRNLQSCDAAETALNAILGAFPACSPCAAQQPSAQPTQPPATQAPATQAPATQAPAQPTPDSDVVVGTYAPNWFVYRKFYMGVDGISKIGGKISVDQNSWDLVWEPKHSEDVGKKITHMYYAFYDLTEDCVVSDIDKDASWGGGAGVDVQAWVAPQRGACKGMMNDMMALKKKYPHVHLLISIGGWTYSRHFSKCAATADGRNKIWTTTKFWLSQMDQNWGKSNGMWSGVDLDWEFPESASGLYTDHASDDWDKFVTLTQELKAKAQGEGRNQFLVTSAIGVGETLTKLVARPSTTKAFCEAMDFVNVMSYDIWGKWDPTTGHNAPFCLHSASGNPEPGIWVSKVINDLINAGCPAKKLNLGLPNYEPAWAGIEAGPSGNGLFQKSTFSDGWAKWSTFSDSDTDIVPQGLITFWDMQNTLSQGFQVHRYDCPADMGIVVPIKWVYNSSKKLWASYEDEEVVEQKVKWAKKKGLAGFFFWDAQQDKNLVLMNAASKAWGVPEKSASGSWQCQDGSKPDYTKDPLTGQTTQFDCDINTGKSIRSPSSVFEAKQQALTVCAKPICTGGSRNNDGKCYPVCTANWAAGSVDLWGGDVVHYKC